MSSSVLVIVLRCISARYVTIVLLQHNPGAEACPQLATTFYDDNSLHCRLDAMRDDLTHAHEELNYARHAPCAATANCDRLHVAKLRRGSCTPSPHHRRASIHGGQ